MTLKQTAAWLALVLLLLLIVNILFIHVFVKESVVIYLLYVLIVYFGMGKGWRTPPDATQADLEEDMDAEPQNPALETDNDTKPMD